MSINIPKNTVLVRAFCVCLALLPLAGCINFTQPYYQKLEANEKSGIIGQANCGDIPEDACLAKFASELLDKASDRYARMTSYRAKSFVSHRLYILLAPGVFTEDLERYSFDLECDFSLKHPSRIEGEFYSNIVSKTLSPYLSTWMSRIKEGSQDSDLPVERFQEPANFARKGDAGEVFKVPVVSDKIGEETDALERKISSVNLPLTDRVMSRQYLKGYLSGIKDIKLKGSRRCENEKCYLVSFEKKYFEGEKVFLEFWIGAESLNIYKMEEIDVVNGDTIALTEELHTGITMQ